MKKQLLINPRFEKFSPPKKPEEMERLRQSLSDRGYVGLPILTWHNYIVDGHNRYHVCKDLGIEIDIDKNVEEIDLGDDATEIDAMDWMLTHQLSSKNLTPGEKLAMTEEFQEEVKLENEKRKSEAIAESNRNRNLSCVQLDTIEICNQKPNPPRDRSLNTREQIAQKAGVSTGTVARYNKVMNSGDEDLKQKVKTGAVTVNKAYEEVRKREVRTCKICGKEKKIIDFFGDDEICKECSRRESAEHIDDPRFTSYASEETKKNFKDVLTKRDPKENIDQDFEIQWLKDTCKEFITRINERYFDSLASIEKMDKEHIHEAYNVMEEFVSNMFDLQGKFEERRNANERN